MNQPNDNLAQGVLERLWKLPAKVARPLQDLLDREHISLESLKSVLDAGDLSGQPHKLVGFAVSYYHLRVSGVPVDDVIEMAQSQGRRIRLDWKPNRWKAEHEQLSRAATLLRLSSLNVKYDLSKFEVHLPPCFPGYLIRSSRRLGMEGLRQRHCIASYHQQIMAGYTAIASVFVEGKRWTVQLRNQLDPDAPIWVSQIKSRYNQPASQAVRERILSMLGIEIPVASQQDLGAGADDGPRERRFRQNLRAILPVLRAHGLASVVVGFEGSGDSGSIDGACYFPTESGFDGAITMTRIHQVNRLWHPTQRQWCSELVRQEVCVNDALERIVEDYLEFTDVNWYDNDGGYGSFQIDVVSGNCSMEVNQRIIDSNQEFYEELEIEGHEDADVDLPRPDAA